MFEHYTLNYSLQYIKYILYLYVYEFLHIQNYHIFMHMHVF